MQRPKAGISWPRMRKGKKAEGPTAAQQGDEAESLGQSGPPAGERGVWSSTAHVKGRHWWLFCMKHVCVSFTDYNSDTIKSSNFEPTI